MNDIKTVLNKKMPRYNEIPNVGLYLEQVVTYINEVLEPFRQEKLHLYKSKL